MAFVLDREQVRDGFGAVYAMLILGLFMPWQKEVLKRDHAEFT